MSRIDKNEPVASKPPMMNKDEMLSKFDASMDKNEIVEILKELFDKNVDSNGKPLPKIPQITDLSKDEISLITRIHMIGKIKSIPCYQQAIDYFMMLRLSLKRASRREIIDAIRGYQQQKSMMQKIGGMFGNNNG